MDLKGKDILIISPQSWGKNKVSKHHYASELASSGGRVFFLDPPSREKGKREFELGAELEPGLWKVSHRRPVKGLRFYPSYLRKRLMKEQVRRIETECGVEGFDLVWSFEGSRFFDLALFGEKALKIFHMVDLVQDENLPLVSGSADLVLGTTSFIEEKVRPYVHRFHKVPHGCRSERLVEDRAQVESDRPLAGYLGNLGIPFIDQQLLAALPERFPEIGLYLVGPQMEEDDEVLKSLEKASNVEILGPVPSEEIPSYLARMDVLLILYDAERYPEQVAAPHKVMDYLASGKVIVSTWMEEHREHRDLIRMVERQEDLIPAFKEVVEDLETWNAPELQKRRKAIAESRTYDKLLDRILEKAHEAKPSFFE